MKKINCPKVYFSFDVSICDCKECKAGKLYKNCDLATKENPHQACDGWAEWDKDTGNGGVYCCSCYRKKYENIQEYQKSF